MPDLRHSTLAKANASKEKSKQGGATTAPKKTNTKKRLRTLSHADSSQAAKKPKGPSLAAQDPRTKAGKSQRGKGKPGSTARPQIAQNTAAQSETNEPEIEDQSGSEEESESDLDGEKEAGIDEQDYDDVDLQDPFESANWNTGGNGKQQGQRHARTGSAEDGQSQASDSDAMEVDVDRQDDSGRSKLSRSQLRRQTEEQPVFGHRRSVSTASTSTRSLVEDEFLSDNSDNYNGDPESIQVIIARGSRYPALRRQPPRVAAVVRRAFGVSELKIILCTAYPPVGDSARFFRGILREAAVEIEDDEIAHKIKTDALFGNALGALVKARYTLYRREIRTQATTEARAAYQLKAGASTGQKVHDLLLDDTFVYGVDDRGHVLSSEPYRHPGVISMVQFFFKDNRSVGRLRADSFKSSISAEQHEERSQENELPIPMVAFSVAMLRSELLLWKSGHRDNIQFDADAHSNAFDHHVDALQELQNRFPVKFHRLMHFLYIQGSGSAHSAASEGQGVLGKLDWEADSE